MPGKKGKKISSSKKLTPKQELFCKSYVLDLNGKQAAIRCGYSKHTAESQASRLLRNAKVRERIKQLTKKTYKKLEITAERIIEELGRVAFSDIRKFYDEQGDIMKPQALSDDAAAALSGIEIDEIFVDGFKKGETKKIKMHNKLAALDALAKHFGLFSKDNEQKKPEATIFYLPDDGRNKKA